MLFHIITQQLNFQTSGEWAKRASEFALPAYNPEVKTNFEKRKAIKQKI